MTIIRVIDLETTGFDATDKVIEIGTSDYEVETKAISAPVSKLFYVDAIPPESRSIHHIGLSDIPAGAAPFDAFADIHVPADDQGIVYFAAHNAKFEAQWLNLREGDYLICTWKAALRIWPEAPSHSNGALRYWLEDQGKIALDRSLAYQTHRAGPDAYITAHILAALFAAGATGKQMVQWTREYAVLPTCPIGEWRGKPWNEVDGGFLGWMVKKVGMEEEYKWNAQREIDRRQGSTS